MSISLLYLTTGV